VYGLGCMVYGIRFGAFGLGYMVDSVWFSVGGLERMVWGGLRISGDRFVLLSGLRIRVSDLRQ